MSAMPDRLKVTVSDVVTGEVLGERVIYDDYVLVCAGHVYLSAVQQHGNGTHQLTVKNCGAPSLNRKGKGEVIERPEQISGYIQGES